MNNFYVPERDAAGRFVQSQEEVSPKKFCRDFSGRFAPWQDAWKYTGRVSVVLRACHRIMRSRRQSSASGGLTAARRSAR